MLSISSISVDVPGCWGPWAARQTALLVPCPGRCPIGHVVLERDEQRYSLTSCRISGSETELCPGGDHYVKRLGLVQSGVDTSSPPEPGEDTALAELLCQPHRAGQRPARPILQPALARHFPAGPGSGPGVGEEGGV